MKGARKGARGQGDRIGTTSSTPRRFYISRINQSTHQAALRPSCLRSPSSIAAKQSPKVSRSAYHSGLPLALYFLWVNTLHISTLPGSQKAFDSFRQTFTELDQTRSQILLLRSCTNTGYWIPYNSFHNLVELMVSNARYAA